IEEDGELHLELARVLRAGDRHDEHAESDHGGGDVAGPASRWIGGPRADECLRQRAAPGAPFGDHANGVASTYWLVGTTSIDRLAPKRSVLSPIAVMWAVRRASSPAASKNTCRSVSAAIGNSSSTMPSTVGALAVSGRTTTFCV